LTKRAAIKIKKGKEKEMKEIKSKLKRNNLI